MPRSSHERSLRQQFASAQELVNRLTFEQIDQESDKANWRDEPY